MTRRSNTDNIGHSVQQRLLNRSKLELRDPNEIRQRYAMERFLYRLSQSKYRGRFILKGALMLGVWNNTAFRPTKDIDLLGRINNDPETLISAIRTICDVDVEPDGMIYDPKTVTAETITADAEYHGTRIVFDSFLNNKRL